MALKEELTALIAAENAATNAVAAELAKLQTQVADALANPDTLSPEDAAAIEAGFQQQIDQLTVLGKDPANPNPAPAPAPAV